MNRTQRSLGPAKPEPVDAVFQLESLASGLVETSCQDTAYTLFAPLHYEPGYSYPLLVWLHGPGGDERQLVRIMPLVSMRNYVAIAPRGTLAVRPDETRSGYAWPQADEHIRLAEQRIFACVATAQQKFHIAPERIFLAGFDCGGTMAFRIAMSHPESFAGVLSLCGAFPSGHAPFRNLARARQLPIFLAIGRDSQQYPPEAACLDLRLFHSAGMSVTLRQYPYGHELAPQMLGDVDRWIIEQITAPRTAAETSV